MFVAACSTSNEEHCIFLLLINIILTLKRLELNAFFCMNNVSKRHVVFSASSSSRIAQLFLSEDSKRLFLRECNEVDSKAEQKVILLKEAEW